MTPTGDLPNNKWKMYLVSGIVFLFLMAILWGADPSFRYLTVGFAAYFLFMAFWLRPRTVEYTEADEAFDQLKDDLKTIFSKKTHSYKSPRTTAPRRNDPRVIGIAGIFIFFVFTSITLAVVFLSDDQTAQSEQSDPDTSAETYEIESLRAAVTSDPGNTDALINLGNAFVQSAEYDSALKYYQRAVEIDGSEKAAHYNIALVEFFQEKYRSSIARLRKTLTIDPEYQMAMALAGDNYYAEQNYDSALYWYEETYRRGERNPDLSHRLAYIYDTKGNISQAVIYYKETVNLDSSRAEVYGRLGELMEGDEAQRYRDLASRYVSN